MTTTTTTTWAEPQPTPLALLLLGRGADPDTEKGVACPGELPPASDPDLVARAARARAVGVTIVSCTSLDRGRVGPAAASRLGVWRLSLP